MLGCWSRNGQDIKKVGCCAVVTGGHFQSSFKPGLEIGKNLVPLKSIVVVKWNLPCLFLSVSLQSEEASQLQDFMGTHISDF